MWPKASFLRCLSSTDDLIERGEARDPKEVRRGEGSAAHETDRQSASGIDNVRAQSPGRIVGQLSRARGVCT